MPLGEEELVLDAATKDELRFGGIVAILLRCAELRLAVTGLPHDLFQCTEPSIFARCYAANPSVAIFMIFLASDRCLMSTPPWAAALVHDEDLIAEVFRVGRGYPAFIHCLLLPEPQPLPEVLLEYAMINDATDLACIFLQWQLGAVTCVEEVVAAALQFGGAVVLAKILQIGRARAPYNIIFPEALRGALSLRTLGIHPRLVLRLVNAAGTPVANPPWREG